MGMILAVVAGAGHAALGAELCVSPKGDDANPGTVERPFRTLARAVRAVEPGDTCYLREGRNRETVTLRNVDAEVASITFAAYPGEQPVLDGTVPLQVNWEPWRGRVYRARLDHDVWQLFIDGRLVDVARWPDASLEDGSVWQMERSMRHVDRGTWKGNRMFLEGRHAVRQVVWLGPAPDRLRRVAQVDATNTVAPGTLLHGRTYWWRVETVQADGTMVLGPVWTFTVADTSHRNLAATPRRVASCMRIGNRARSTVGRRLQTAILDRS